MPQDKFKDSEAEPLLWMPSLNYGTEDSGKESSTFNEPTEPIPKRKWRRVGGIHHLQQAYWNRVRYHWIGVFYKIYRWQLVYSQPRALF